jgi:hypothetical protein
MTQLSEFGFNEIFPKILMRETENIKKIKKKNKIIQNRQIQNKLTKN